MSRDINIDVYYVCDSCEKDMSHIFDHPSDIMEIEDDFDNSGWTTAEDYNGDTIYLCKDCSPVKPVAIPELMEE